MISYDNSIPFDILVVVIMDSMMRNASLMVWSEVVIVIGMWKKLR